MAQHINAKKLPETAAKNTKETTKKTNKTTKNNSAAAQTTMSAAGNPNSTANKIINNTLRRRARALLKDISVDGPIRSIIRYALETNDPWLPELVRRADSGELNIETLDFSQRPPGETIKTRKRL